MELLLVISVNWYNFDKILIMNGHLLSSYLKKRKEKEKLNVFRPRI